MLWLIDLSSVDTIAGMAELMIFTRAANYLKDSIASLQMRGTLAPGQAWDVVVDLFFYREPEETKDEGEEATADAFGGVPAADAGYGGAAGLPAPPGNVDSFGGS